jgi:hypothetical protein
LSISAILLLGAGCTTTTRFVVARTDSAPLLGVERPAVAFQAPAGQAEAGESLARTVAGRLRAAGLGASVGTEGEGDPADATVDGTVPDGTVPDGTVPDGTVPDGTVMGWIENYEPDQGRLSVRLQVMRSGVLVTVPAVEVVGGPRGASALLAEAGARVAGALLPGPDARVEVEWESAAPWDELAQEHMAAEDVASALGALEDGLRRAKAAAVDVETLASLHYDLGLCLDLVGRDAEAERALDEALTLFASERHLDALHTLRRRRGAPGGGGRP